MSVIPTQRTATGPDARALGQPVESPFARSDGPQSHFWLHFVEMFAVTVLGMIVSAAIFLTILRTNWDEATAE